MRARGARRAAAGLALTALALLVGCSDTGTTNTANGSNPPAAPAGGMAEGSGGAAAGGLTGTPPQRPATQETAEQVHPEAPATETHETEEEEHWEEPAPGDWCSLEEGLPDCIDPDGDGEGTYLIGGADCLADWPDDPSYCEDLDGDGYAGYPDGEGYGEETEEEEHGEGDGDHGSEGDEYGDWCDKADGHPDCVDPDGDGEGTILQYGEECIAMYADDALCEDTDGDLVAGETGGDGELPYVIDGGEGQGGGDGDHHGSEGPEYGDPCSKEEGSPDCVDPDGDGEGTILRYGEECIAMYADDALCEDTDGDLVAGETGGDGELPYVI